MQKPWHPFVLSIWTAFCPVRGQDVQPSALDPVEIIYFDRGSSTLSPAGVRKLEQLIQDWKGPGGWVIGVPRNSGVRDQVIQGRIRAMIGVLIEHGIVGIKTISTPPIPRERFDPILIGKRKASSSKEVDPNEDEPTEEPKRVIPLQPLEAGTSLRKEEIPRSFEPLAPPRVDGEKPSGKSMEPPSPPVRWVEFNGTYDYKSIMINKPPTAKFEMNPYHLIGVNFRFSPNYINIGLGYSKTITTIFSGNEQTDPDRNLNVSDKATNYYSKISLSIHPHNTLAPIALSYHDETYATTAILPLGSLLFDRTGFGWISIVEGVKFAYKMRNQELAIDWRIRDWGLTSPGISAGIHYNKIENPYNIQEFGSNINTIIYAANFNMIGFHGKIEGDPSREGAHLDAIEFKYSHAKGINLLDSYHFLNIDPSKNTFHEIGIKFCPNYLINSKKHGFIRITAPLELSKITSKRVNSINLNGDKQEAGLYGGYFSYGLKIDVGLRF